MWGVVRYTRLSCICNYFKQQGGKGANRDRQKDKNRDKGEKMSFWPPT